MKTSISMADELWLILRDQYGPILDQTNQKEVDEIYRHLLGITCNINFLREKYEVI